jgi:hypothetical protein
LYLVALAPGLFLPQTLRHFAKARPVAERDGRRPQLVEELGRLRPIQTRDVGRGPELGVQQACGHRCRIADAGASKHALDTDRALQYCWRGARLQPGPVRAHVVSHGRKAKREAEEALHL